ncbi:MAG: YvcK family protein [Tissierellia bacterium]|nr:YvcK family protein [Tissierellia bacterium]
MKKKSKLKIVTVGGGTGSSVMLFGLKKYTDNITAIVTVADDGGGSGILREDLGMLPPGDIRACLIALSNSENDMEKLLGYRFGENCGRLAGQSFGNLFLAALNGVYGDFEIGLKEASKVLAITGKVLPMTLDDVVLYAELEDGSIIEGESNITFLTRKSGGRIKRVYLEPELSTAPFESMEEIKNADIIILGPGSLYTSVMPNLLVNDIREAIMKSNAIKLYICNVMTQTGETDGYSPYDHLNAIVSHCDNNFIDYIFVNDTSIPEDVKLRYFYKDSSVPVYIDDEEETKIENMGTKVVRGNFIDIKHAYIRHNSDEVSKKIIELFDK